MCHAVVFHSIILKVRHEIVIQWYDVQSTFQWVVIYIFSMLVFVNKNRELFLSNSEIHDINTWYNHNLHLPSTNITLVQKGVLYSGSRIYSHLPLSIKALSNDAKSFKTTFKSYLTEHAFYSLDEYYQFQWLWFLFILFIFYSIYIIYLVYLQFYFNYNW
jgi:hypothetical protein